ncbi:MAG: TonB-dependent receptor, partial [Flavobacteriales bacterium]|nr:TonB-dependent receptor [Flavobacteriales bacterium]
DEIKIFLSQKDYSLPSVQVPTDRNIIEFQPLESDLVEILGKEVRLLKSGPTVSKPILQGFSGNRLQIVTSGIALNNQKWGVDHAPEVDYAWFDEFNVVTGSDVLVFQGEHLGRVINGTDKIRLSKRPLSIRQEFNTNGLGFRTSMRYAKKWNDLTVKGVLGYMSQGDLQSPGYYLTNTAMEVLTGFFQLNYTPTQWLELNAQYSRYQGEFGVMRGSHIGNTTDLDAALTVETPFFTEDQFDRSIDAPRQEVTHDLGSAKAKIQITPLWRIEALGGLQLNNRDEYDVRRGGRTTRPSLSLSMESQYGEFKVVRQKGDSLIEVGYQFTRQDNLNNPETGILPLIPDFITRKVGGYAKFTRPIAISKSKYAKLSILARYDQVSQRVATFSVDIPRVVERFNLNWNTGGVGAGIQYRSYRLDLLYFTRAPHISELFSRGLHQAASGIEYGNRDLGSESLFKVQLEATEQVNRFKGRLAVHAQQVDGFIYLQPLQKPELTIRGAFPVFEYRQTDAQTAGVDASLEYRHDWDQPSSKGPKPMALRYEIGYSFFKGWDLQNDLSVINLPSNRAYITAEYLLQTEEYRVTGAIRYEYVFERSDIELEQDFAPPPPSYSLLGGKLEWQWLKHG